MCFRPVNLSSAAAAITLPSRIRAAAASCPWEILKSRSSSVGQCRRLKAAEFANPLIPMILNLSSFHPSPLSANHSDRPLTPVNGSVQPACYWHDTRQTAPADRPWRCNIVLVAIEPSDVRFLHVKGFDSTQVIPSTLRL